MKRGSRVEGLRVRVVCLPVVETQGRLDLAQIGANARRAVQDSSAIAYLGETTRSATRFSETILETAEVPQLPGPDGAAAMTRLLDALESAGTSDSLRESIDESLD